MIVLDTNVLSALMRTNPESVVVDWLDRQPADSVWLTSITVFEARFGLALLPKGRRRSGLEPRLSWCRRSPMDLPKTRRIFSSWGAPDVTGGRLEPPGVRRSRNRYFAT